MPSSTVRQILAETTNILNRPAIPTPELDAELIICFVLGTDRSWLISHLDAPILARQAKDIAKLAENHATGRPIAQIVGTKEFFGLDFVVTPDVLIPRPETEELVEYALKLIEKHPLWKKVIDVGTGSGAIICSLAKHKPGLEYSASDVSAKALKIAGQNLENNKVTNVKLIKSNLFDNIPTGQFDLVLANLPYLPETDIEKSNPISFEPLLALFGGKDGLDLIEKLVADLPNRLALGGVALLEIGYNQGKAVTDIARQNGLEAQVIKDLNGFDRIVQISKN